MQSYMYHPMSQLHIESTQKFKDTTISVRFLSELTEKSATTLAILALIMEDRNQYAATKQQMTQWMDQLYGAKLDVRSIGYGKSISFEVRSKVIDDRYIDRSIAKEHFEWLLTMIQYPLLSAETLKEAKLMLKATLLRNQDSATKYAINQAFTRAGAGYPLSIDTSGSLDVLDDITLDDVKSAHAMLLSTARVDVFVITSAQPQMYQALFEHSYLNTTRVDSETMYTLQHRDMTQEMMKKELKQTNLVMVYNAQIIPSDELYWPLRVALVALGQLPSSLCFTEIREKRSLCYFIGANMVTFDGAVYVYTGIDAKEKQQVIQLVGEQIQRIIDGDIDENLLVNSKTMMINSLYGMVDDPFAMINFLYQRLLMKSDVHMDSVIQKIQQVSMAKMGEAMASLVLRTIFSLEPMEEQA